MKRYMARIFWLLILALGAALPSYARDASFLSSGTSSSGPGAEEAMKVDPKGDIDIGETSLNVAKRTSIFFINQAAIAVKVEKVVVAGDASVTSEITANDCEKQSIVVAQSRCSVEVAVTPTTPGPWSVDVLMTHNGAGRITRARLTGKTVGTSAVDTKNTGLSVSSKETKRVDFGSVNLGDSKVARSTLLVNDSPEAITIYSIDVIEADNGLQKLDQGCAVDMELAPGASCPVTLVWKPKTNGTISTDLIIRHSGKLGFAVVPIRGLGKGGDEVVKSSGGGKSDIVALPPSAQDLEKEMAGKILPVSKAVLARHPVVADDVTLQLIGTVGERAVLLKPDGKTVVVPVGGEFDVDGVKIKLIAVSARSADIVMKGKKQTLPLEAAASLISAAADQAQQGSSSSPPAASFGPEKGRR